MEQMERAFYFCTWGDDPPGEPSTRRALGSLLRLRAASWNLFLGRFGLPPFKTWEDLPGFERLQCGLAVAGQDSLSPEDLLAWAIRNRPAWAPERAQPTRMTPEGQADRFEEQYRELVRAGGGVP